MIRSRTRAYGTAILLGIVAAISGNSCGPRRPETKAFPKNTGEREQEAPGTTPPTRLGGPLEPTGSVTFSVRKTPDLDVDITQLKEGDLLKYLNGLVYDADTPNGEIEVVACTHATPAGDVDCAPGDGVRLFIEPEIGAHKWAHGDFTTGHGAVIARILNYETDDRKEKTFGFPAHTKVWWFVDFDPVKKQPRSRFFKRTYSAQPPFVEQVGGDQPFYDCGHVHPVHHGHAIAKYVSCSQSLTMQPGRAPEHSATSIELPNGIFQQASFKHAVPLPARPMVMALTATWITCDMGCCSTTH